VHESDHPRSTPRAQFVYKLYDAMSIVVVVAAVNASSPVGATVLAQQS
jgi:hypothetical protein